MKLFTCFLGALIGPMLYALVKICFTAPVARWSSVAVTFVPSLVLWSASNLKDIPLILLSLLLFWALVTLRSRPLCVRNLAPIIAVALMVFVHTEMRSAVYSYAVLACFLASIWLTGRITWAWRLLSIMLVMIGIFLVRDQLHHGIVEALDVHIGHVATIGTSYRFLPPEFYEMPTEQWAQAVKFSWSFLLVLAKGVGHYLVQPPAWKVDSLFQLLAYPQMQMWYAVLSFGLYGMALSLVQRRFGPTFLVLVAWAWIVIGALTSGNAGTLFRMRDMVTPLVVTFAVYGLWMWAHGKDAPQPVTKLPKLVQAATGGRQQVMG